MRLENLHNQKYKEIKIPKGFSNPKDPTPTDKMEDTMSLTLVNLRETEDSRTRGSRIDFLQMAHNSFIK